MSEEEFEVRGVHDDAIDEAAERGGGDPFVGRIALTTAILATIGAVLSYEGGATQANALLYKNEAAIRKAEAANQWNFYQAKSNKLNLAEVAVLLVTRENQPRFKAEVERYEKEKAEISKEAQKFEGESKAQDELSEHALHVHHRYALATTFLQIAIALSAIALLTRKKWLQWGVYGISLVGIVLGVSAFVIQ